MSLNRWLVIAKPTADVVIAGIGVDMGRFPTAGHLASWAGPGPGHPESAGKSRSGRARKGNDALRVALCEDLGGGRTRIHFVETYQAFNPVLGALLERRVHESSPGPTTRLWQSINQGSRLMRFKR